MMIIAQISDIHASPENNNLLRFEQALLWLEMIKPDAVVLTGDLTDENWLQGYAHIAVMSKKYSWLTLILPGNSDDSGAMRRTWDDNNWHPTSLPDSMNFNVALGEVCLIGVDTTLKGESSGDIRRNIDWLDKQLKANGGMKTMMFMHHHIVKSGIPTMDDIMCRGHEELRQLLLRHRSKPLAIATGHVHRSMAGMFAGIPAYICGSICPANPLWFGSDGLPTASDPPSIMVYRLENNMIHSYPVSIPAL